MNLPATKKHLIKVLPTKQAFYCHEDSTVLDAALQAGLALPHSCRGGNCGSCLASLNIGQIAWQHDTEPLGITPEQRQEGQVLLCQIQPRSQLSITVRTPQTDRGACKVVQLPCRMIQKEHVADDVMKIFLQLPRSQPLAFAAGQHIDLLLERGRRRSYSIACAPSDAEPLELHVRRVENGYFSNWLFSDEQSNSLLRLEGPFGDFCLSDSSRDIIMVAGGTGFAPLKSMLLSVLPALARRVHLFWGARDQQDLYDLALVTGWAEQYGSFSFTPVVASSSQERPDTETGLVHLAVLERYPNLAAFDVYASGPPTMIAALSDDFIAAGANPEALYLDAFNYAV